MDEDRERRRVCLLDLRPSNWYIRFAKLNRVREAWQHGAQNSLPPVLVTEIDGELSLIDGHSRSYAAFEGGVAHVDAIVASLGNIEGSTALCRHIHRTCPTLDIETIADLRAAWSSLTSMSDYGWAIAING